MERIHLDFTGTVEGNTLLIVMDAFSKWPEVVLMKDTTAESTIEELEHYLPGGGFLFKL